MPAMTLLTSFVALAGGFAAGALGAQAATYSNNVATETAAPQELGSITAAGSLVYSLNVCTMVHSTNCQVSTSTGGAAPPAEQPSAVSPSSGPKSGPPAGTSPVQSGASQPAPTTAEQSTDSEGHPTTGGASSTGAPSDPAPTQSGVEPSGSPGTPLPTAAGASNAIGALRGAAIGVGAVAVAFLV